jgi:hypothetical protein
MIQPPQAAIGLALLPEAWAASERGQAERRGPAPREREDDLARYFPAGWSRETLADWPVTVASSARRMSSSWQGLLLGALLRGAVWRVRRIEPGFPRG